MCFSVYFTQTTINHVSDPVSRPSPPRSLPLLRSSPIHTRRTHSRRIKRSARHRNQWLHLRRLLQRNNRLCKRRRRARSRRRSNGTSLSLPKTPSLKIPLLTDTHRWNPTPSLQQAASPFAQTPRCSTAASNTAANAGPRLT